MSSGLTLQGRRGAPGGNTNAGKDGLWSARPPVRIEVAAAVPLPQLAGLAETISGGALWIAEALADVEHPQVDEGEVEQKIALYAAVAGEAAHLQAVLEGRTGVRPAPLGELTPQRYERLTRQSAGALSLMPEPELPGGDDAENTAAGRAARGVCGLAAGRRGRGDGGPGGGAGRVG